MKRLMLPAGLALAAVTPGVAAAAIKSDGATPTQSTAAHQPLSANARAYEHVYAAVARKFGPRTPGRNIVKDGLANGRPPGDAQILASLTVLRRMLAPPPAPTYSTTSTTSAPTSSAGASGVPACASESGTNYSTGASNTNSSSGATGRYQILPSTAAGYGCDLSTPSGQDACAQTIYQHQGASAWVGCGG